MSIDFETWKRDYAPVMQMDNVECDEHDEECECEFLYPFESWEILDDEDNRKALVENRVWTWLPNSEIVSGWRGNSEYYLITEKPFTEEITVK